MPICCVGVMCCQDTGILSLALPCRHLQTAVQLHTPASSLSETGVQSREQTPPLPQSTLCGPWV